ncbi:putative acid-CoA ligase [Oceanicola granulosus HTCC2516]|uniref:3-methylmercaptopropionyl-CoA ligase n=1 Tax=Oceanicola granulosus (strain ATCC BAA-861 / DSM 15982 / KCTC 12143 / HTCC2516) TaxID=314256 RepID=Q2CBN5_OCEGH|nr:AMP-binding protein [Oceanicola granulosus]EAR50096.1 putative acid-CoA ligase [Oceanicola granulosus HTCC2516]
MFDTIPDMAASRAALSPGALAFRCRRDWTFAEVDAAASGIAAGLTASGLAEGDRLAILCHNAAEFFLTLFACQKTGIILCPLNWRQPAPELLDTLAPVAPRALLHDAAHAGLAAEIARAASLERHDFARLMEWAALPGPAPVPVPAGRPWYLLFTSGTTGRPKAVIQTARMAWANALNAMQATGLGAADRSVNYLPLFHTAGINLFTLPIFLAGGSSTILPKFDAAALLALCRAGEVSQFFGVPAIYRAFSLDEGVGEVDWSAIRCGCGGAPLPEPLIRLFAGLGARVLNGYGMTETGPMGTLMDPASAETKIGSVGKAQMLSELRLDGVAPGAEGTGEIQWRGPSITPGYYGDRAATEAAFTADGWLRTGDIGRRDADGDLYLIDRLKDMFISGGENVYPAEVERVLHDHPAILEAAVVGVPDDRWGETGAACLLLRPGATLEAAALRDWCRARLAAYKVPARIEVMDDFPRTAAGKVRKADLRERLA